MCEAGPSVKWDVLLISFLLLWQNARDQIIHQARHLFDIWSRDGLLALCCSKGRTGELVCWRKGRHILSSGVCLHDQCADGLDITVIKIPDRKEYLFIWTHSSIAGSYGGRCIIQRSLKKNKKKKTNYHFSFFIIDTISSSHSLPLQLPPLTPPPPPSSAPQRG